MDSRQASATPAPAVDDCFGYELVDQSIPPGGLIKDQVVLPSAEDALVPRPLGHVCGCALLRLADGTVWMLRMPGRAWTRSRILSAARVLAEVSAGAGTNAERRMRQLPGIEGVTVGAGVAVGAGVGSFLLPGRCRGLSFCLTNLPAVAHHYPASVEQRDRPKLRQQGLQPRLDRPLRQVAATAAHQFLHGQA